MVNIGLMLAIVALEVAIVIGLIFNNRHFKTYVSAVEKWSNKVTEMNKDIVNCYNSVNKLNENLVSYNDSDRSSDIVVRQELENIKNSLNVVTNILVDVINDDSEKIAMSDINMKEVDMNIYGKGSKDGSQTKTYADLMDDFLNGEPIAKVEIKESSVVEDSVASDEKPDKFEVVEEE